MAAALDQHRALAFENYACVLLGPPMPKAHDSRVVAIGVAGFEHLAVCVQRVAVKDRRGEADFIQRQLGERVLARILHSQTDTDRAGDEPEDQPPPEVRTRHPMFVVMAVGGVEHELGQHLVFHFADRGAARVAKLRADLEILEVVALAGQRRGEGAHSRPPFGNKRSEMILIWISEVPSKIFVSRASRQYRSSGKSLVYP